MLLAMEDEDQNETFPWSPAAVARRMQETGEEVAQHQSDAYRQLLAASGSGNGAPGFNLGAMGMGLGTATFKARVQSGGRISIPDAEREALDIEEGDLVQTVVIPIKKGDSNE